jgi:hypothetical protein
LGGPRVLPLAVTERGRCGGGVRGGKEAAVCEVRCMDRAHGGLFSKFWVCGNVFGAERKRKL